MKTLYGKNSRMQGKKWKDCRFTVLLEFQILCPKWQPSGDIWIDVYRWSCWLCNTSNKLVLCFVQNISGKVFKTRSRVTKHLQKGEANDIRLYIASILYRGIVGKPLGRMYYTQDEVFETPGFKRIIPQNKLILIEKYIHFDDITELGNEYNRSAKIEPIHAYLVKRWQSLLTLIGSSLSVQRGFGIKSFVLAEASSGYVWNSILYTRQDTMISDAPCFERYHILIFF